MIQSSYGGVSHSNHNHNTRPTFRHEVCSPTNFSTSEFACKYLDPLVAHVLQTTAVFDVLLQEHCNSAVTNVRSQAAAIRKTTSEYLKGELLRGEGLANGDPKW